MELTAENLEIAIAKMEAIEDADPSRRVKSWLQLFWPRPLTLESVMKIKGADKNALLVDAFERVPGGSVAGNASEPGLYRFYILDNDEQARAWAEGRLPVFGFGEEPRLMYWAETRQ